MFVWNKWLDCSPFNKRKEGINITSISSDKSKNLFDFFKGDTVKLWGTPKALTTKLSLEKG